MARSFVAGDYAGITAQHLDLYYGYECTTEDGEWCFSARVGETEVMKVPQSQLKARDKFDCASCLLAGIGTLFDKFSVETETIPRAGLVAKVILDAMTDEERLKLFRMFCRSCGTDNPSCQCWNDE